MGSSVKSATNAVTDAARDVRNEAQRVYRKNVSQGLREEINRTAAVVLPTTYSGNAVAVGTAEQGGDVMAGVNQVADDLGLGETVTVPGPEGQAEQAPTVYDPQQKRRRQAAGRAGTLLTGGMDGGGTNLGGAGGRSTLLGL